MNYYFTCFFEHKFTKFAPNGKKLITQNQQLLTKFLIFVKNTLNSRQ